MRYMVLGGTGSIGSRIVTTLIERCHEVLGLARSDDSAEKLSSVGATPLLGDIRNPAAWLDVVAETDGVVQAAATWDDDMGRVDRKLIESLLTFMGKLPTPKALIYTGGCWFYGNTGDRVADEDSPFVLIDQFAGSIDTMQKVLSAPGIRGMVIHPAMGYEKYGGVFSYFYEDANKLGYVRVIAGENTRWPLVHPQDLALLYALMLEKGKHGDVYNAASIKGFAVGKIARTIANNLSVPVEPKVLSVAEAIEIHGPVVEGYAIDQQMSGRKAMKELGWQPVHLDPIADLV